MTEALAEGLISVIVPVYNGRDGLAACVDSLLAQSYSPLEILLIDDGSTDGSGALCDELSRRDSRIRVIHQPNRGVSAARNMGIAEARGAFLGFVDADDQTEPQMYAFLHQLLLERHADIAACGWAEIMEDGSRRELGRALEATFLPAREAFLAMGKGVYFNGYLCNKLYRRELFFSGQGAPRLREGLTICEDLLLNSQLFAGGATLAYQNIPLYRYTIHPASAMRTFHLKRRDEFVARAEIIRVAGVLGPDVEKEAKAVYAQAAVLYRIKAKKAGAREEERFSRKEIPRYLLPMLSSRMFGAKSKIRFVMLWLCPGISELLWNFLSKRLNMKWTATEKWLS